VPILLSSHTWENGKNEQSHQDPTLCEAWLAEMHDVAPVLFPVDAHSAVQSLLKIYRSQGQVAVLVVPKNSQPAQLSEAQARDLTDQGALCLHQDPSSRVQLVAIGAYQLVEMQRASQRLTQHGVAHCLSVIQEPGRFRTPRDPEEAQALHSPSSMESLLPTVAERVFLVHGHPEVFSGVMRPLDTGERSRFLGYRNRGGTLDTFGMLYANHCTWAHVLQQVAELLGQPDIPWLSADEKAAAQGVGDPDTLR